LPFGATTDNIVIMALGFRQQTALPLDLDLKGDINGFASTPAS
jgi:hypothetical protein